MPKIRDKGAVDEVDLEDRPADVEVFHEVQNFGRFWKVLGREIGVVDEILDIIEQDYRRGGMKEMTFHTLLAWQREKGSNATVKTLAQHLRNTDKKDLADKILRMFLVPKEKVSSHDSHEQAEEMIKSLHGVKAAKAEKRHLREKVATQLTSRYKQFALKGLPWMDEASIPLADYHVDLNMMQQSGTGANKSLKSVKFEEIFSAVAVEKKHAPRILVEGAPGYGKTTFASKLCYDYAQKESYMQHFNLVFFLPLRHFTGDWHQILVKAAGIEANECNTLLAVLNTKNKPILLILDGYDELSEEHQGKVLPLIRGTLFPRLTVVVTSRLGIFHGDSVKHGHEPFTHDIVDDIQWAERLKLTGINEDSQEQFIKSHIKHFSEEKKNEVMEQLLQLREKAIVQPEILECPLFLLITIFLLYKKDNAEQEQYQTKTDLYKNICNFVIRQYAAKQEYQSAAELDVFAKSENSDYVKLMTQFSSFSLKALHTKQLAFSKRDFLQDSSPEADEKMEMEIAELGFLATTVNVNDTWEEIIYEPVHKSLMEFAAAYGLWLMASDETCAGQWADQVALIRPQRSSADSLIFTFLAGLMGEEAAILFHTLRSYEANYVDNFDLLWSTILEVQLTPAVISSLTPFLPAEWNLKWYNDDSTLSTSQNCKDILHHGINSRKIKEMRWNIEHAVCLPDDVQIDKLIIETFQLMPALPVIQCSNFRCTELCFHLNFTYYKSIEDWHNLLSRLLTIPSEKISFTINDSLSFFLPMIYAAVMEGPLSNCHIHKIECHVEEKSSLADIIKLVDITEIDIVEVCINVTPTRNTASTSCHNRCEDQDCQMQWQQHIDDIFTVIAKKSHLTQFILRNKTPHCFTIQREEINESNKTTSKMLWLEGIKVLSYTEELQELNNQHLLPLYQNSTSNKEIRCSVFITAESLQESVKLLCSLCSVQPQTVSLCLFFPYLFILPSDCSEAEETQLEENQKQLMDTLVKLIENEIVSTLEICIDHTSIHDTNDEKLDFSEQNLQQQFDAIVTSSAKSSHLTKFLLKNTTDHNITVDLDRLCDSDKKLWNAVWLEGVNIQCTHGIRETLEIQKPTVLCQYKRKASLEQRCYFVATDETLEEWLIMLSRIFPEQYQDISFSFFGYPYFLSYIYFYLNKIYRIECHLKEKQCHAVETILELITRNTAEILELHLNSPPSPPSSPSVLCNDDCSDMGCDWMSQKQVDTLLSSAAKAQNLTHFALQNNTSFSYIINLEELCNSDQQLRKTVLLAGVKVKIMETGMEEKIEIEECIYAEDVTSDRILEDTLLKSLRLNLLSKIQGSEDIQVQDLEQESLSPATLEITHHEDQNIPSVEHERGSSQVLSDDAIAQTQTSSREVSNTDVSQHATQGNSEDNSYQSGYPKDRSRSVIRSQPTSRSSIQPRSRSESPTDSTPLLPKDSHQENDGGCCNCCCVS